MDSWAEHDVALARLVDLVELAVADPAGVLTDQHLVRAGIGELDLFDAQRPGFLGQDRDAGFDRHRTSDRRWRPPSLTVFGRPAFGYAERPAERRFRREDHPRGVLREGGRSHRERPLAAPPGDAGELPRTHGRGKSKATWSGSWPRRSPSPATTSTGRAWATPDRRARRKWRQFYGRIFDNRYNKLRYDIDRIFCSDDNLFHEGTLNIVFPGKVLRGMGLSVDDPEAWYLYSYRTCAIFPYDENGLAKGEDVYSDGPMSMDRIRKLAPEELPDGLD